MQDAGTIYGVVENSSSDLLMRVGTSDKDIIFKGLDNGVDVVSLTLDMSDAGTAIFNHDIKLANNNKAIFGLDNGGSNLEIFYNGFHSYITNNGYGRLYLRSGDVFITNAAGTETMARFDDDGAVSLYYDNSVKLATTSTGIAVTGNTTFADNGKAIFGGGNDLEIYHDGSNSIISETGTGGIKIFTAGVADSGFYKIGGEALATFEPDGPVTLYHNNVAKLATTSTGVTVTGGASLTSILTIGSNGSGADAMFHSTTSSQYMEWDASMSLTRYRDNTKAVFGNGDDLQIYHDGSHSYIKDTGTGNLVLATSRLSINNAASNEEMISAIQNGAVELFYDNSKKLETTATGVTITGLLTATTKSFTIDHPTKPGKKLRYGSLEGPENGVYTRGKSNNNKIQLPEYWTKLVDKDSITVQLTSIGKPQQLYVERIENNIVYVQSEENRKNINDLNYYYFIQAERIDVEKLQTEIEE